MAKHELIVPYGTRTIHRVVRYEDGYDFYCDGKKKAHMGYLNTGCSHAHGCIGGTDDWGMFNPWLHVQLKHFALLRAKPCKRCCSDLIGQINSEKRKLLKRIIRELKQKIQEDKKVLNAKIADHRKYIRSAEKIGKAL